MTPSQSAVNLRAICPFCDSITLSGRQDPKFYIRPDDGVYLCYHCGAKGKDLNLLENLDVIDEIIKRPLDQTAISKLEDKHPKLDSFLVERGLNDAARRAAVLSSLKYSPEHDAIAILVKDKHGELTGVKYRKLDPLAKPRYLSETGSSNEGFWLIGKDKTKLLVVEGEIDALTAVYAGFNGSVLACQTNRIPNDCVSDIRGFKNVFAIPDKDLGGIELKNSMVSLLGVLKTTFIELPNDIKDLNELLQEEGYEKCSEFVRLQTRSAIEKDTRNLRQSVPELLAFLADEGNTFGQSTGWNSVDSLLGGGLRKAEMTVINAFAKVGKSSFINNLIHNLAKCGKSVGLASFEMDPARSIYPTLISIALETNIRELDNDQRSEVMSIMYEDFKYLENIYSFRRFGYTSWSDVEEWANHCKTIYGIEYLILDHAGFMTEKMTDAEENQQLAKNIKRLTNELGIHIIVVVQAPKTKDGLSIQTAYGGLAWAMNADNFFILERSKDSDTELRVKLEAARYPGANPSSTPALLFYQRESCKLTE